MRRIPVAPGDGIDEWAARRGLPLSKAESNEKNKSCAPLAVLSGEWRSSAIAAGR